MNRREFLLAVGATACTGRGRAEPLEVPTAKQPVAEPRTIICEDPSITHTNFDASPLAIHGDLLVQEVNDELWLWDLPTMRRIDAYSLGQDAFTLLGDGSIATFGPRANEGGCAVQRLARGVLSTHPTLLCGGAVTLVLRTGGTDSIYIVHSQEIRRLRFGGPEVEVDATIEIPVASFSNRGQMFSLDDGRVVAPGDGISILEPGKAAVRRPMGKVYPRHLARATAERFWYSRASRTYNAFDTLVLAHLDAPEVDPQSRTFAPSRIVHMASHGSAIAVLLMTPRKMDYSRTVADDTWQVAVVDEYGIERWRAEVPPQPRPYRLNYRGAVTLSATRLVLRTPSDALLAWDAATGVPVAVTPPA